MNPSGLLLSLTQSLTFPSILGQLHLRDASVLIVGVGGLGCPAATYIAGAGIGTLGLVDGDTVELSNLHRQILHSAVTAGKLKVESAIRYLQQLNPRPKYRAHTFHLTPATAVELFEQYDLVLDCTDHPTTRYLISDAAVLAGKPLVSASAIRTEGQLLLLNLAEGSGMDTRGMCYRCVFPKPPPANTIQTCGEGGILGPVVGVMGVLMAVETIKIITSDTSRLGSNLAVPGWTLEHPSMLLYSAYSNPPFRSIRLKGKRNNCVSCSLEATITRDSLASGSLDYGAFCGLHIPEEMLDPDQRVSATQCADKSTIYSTVETTAAHNFRKNNHLDQTASNLNKKSKGCALVDVRSETEFELCHLSSSINIPIRTLEDGARDEEGFHSRYADALDREEVFVVCRQGNDSQKAVRILERLEHKRRRNPSTSFKDVRGGLNAWRKEVDPTFPEY